MDRFEQIKIIGRGNYGAAHLVKEKDTGKRFVVKKVPINEMTPEEREQASQEVVLLARLNHANVVKYHESFVEGNVLHIVMQYCSGGDLAHVIKACAKAKQPLDEEQVLDLFVQLLLGVRYIHRQRILHRDLKTSNIFLCEGNVVKLGDFGIARVLDSTLEQAKTVVGTPYYMSPEVCESKAYNFKSDLWALGCILYEMCTLKHAFDSNNLLGLVFKIVQEKAEPIPDTYSEGLKFIVSNLLAKSPDERMTIDEILALPVIRVHMEGLSRSGGTLGKPLAEALKTAILTTRQQRVERRASVRRLGDDEETKSSRQRRRRHDDGRGYGSSHPADGDRHPGEPRRARNPREIMEARKRARMLQREEELRRAREAAAREKILTKQRAAKMFRPSMNVHEMLSTGDTIVGSLASPLDATVGLGLGTRPHASRGSPSTRRDSHFGDENAARWDDHTSYSSEPYRGREGSSRDEPYRDEGYDYRYQDRPVERRGSGHSLHDNDRRGSGHSLRSSERRGSGHSYRDDDRFLPTLRSPDSGRPSRSRGDDERPIRSSGSYTAGGLEESAYGRPSPSKPESTRSFYEDRPIQSSGRYMIPDDGLAQVETESRRRTGSLSAKHRKAQHDAAKPTESTAATHATHSGKLDAEEDDYSSDDYSDDFEDYFEDETHDSTPRSRVQTNDWSRVVHEIGHVDDPVPEEDIRCGGKVDELEDIPMSATGVVKINNALRQEIIDELGKVKFEKVYKILREQATGKISGKDVKKALLKVVGEAGYKSTNKVDMLIWQEDNYRGTEGYK